MMMNAQVPSRTRRTMIGAESQPSRRDCANLRSVIARSVTSVSVAHALRPSQASSKVLLSMYAREPAELARQQNDHAVGFDILHPAERVEKRPQHERILEDPKEGEERLDEAPVTIEGVHYRQ
jgi:hypothetical protein